MALVATVKQRVYWWGKRLQVTKARLQCWGLCGVLVNALAQAIIKRDEVSTWKAKGVRQLCRVGIGAVQLGSEFRWGRLVGTFLRSLMIGTAMLFTWHYAHTEVLAPLLQQFQHATLEEQQRLMALAAQHPAPTAACVLFWTLFVFIVIAGVGLLFGRYTRCNGLYYERYARACVGREADDDL